MYSDLRKLREERGLSVKQLAELSGVPEEKIIEIENGIFPELDAHLKFAKEHDIDPVELFELQCEELDDDLT
jgi:transcriptional regulator with XRE-family HTH domain